MMIGNVSFGIYAFMPQGWLFMITIILLESLIVAKYLNGKYYELRTYKNIGISNGVSGLTGIIISVMLNGGWILVVWFPWVSKNEVRTDDVNNIYGLAIFYSLALILSVLIELAINRRLFKEHDRKNVYKATLIANLTSYLLGTLALYGYSFN